LEHDPGESQNLAADHSEAIAEIMRLVDDHRATLEVPPSQLEIPLAAE
jgi:hypothetical protein